MALFIECMPSCAQIVLDTADIVRDGDLSPVALLLRVIITRPRLLGHALNSGSLTGRRVSLFAFGRWWFRLLLRWSKPGEHDSLFHWGRGQCQNSPR
jgi:hypothetical protein